MAKKSVFERAKAVRPGLTKTEFASLVQRGRSLAASYSPRKHDEQPVSQIVALRYAGLNVP